MTLMEKLQQEAAMSEDTEVSTRARMSTNAIGRKLYETGDVISALLNDFNDSENNEEIEDGKRKAAVNKLFGSAGEDQIHSQYVYDPINDEYINMSPSNKSANDLVYEKKVLEEEATKDSKTFYDAHYSGDEATKIGITGSKKGFDGRHPLGGTRGAMVEEDKLKDAAYFEDEVKNYMMDRNSNVFKPKGYEPREEGHKNFLELGLDKGQTEIFDKAKLAVSLDDIAAAIDTAATPEEKSVLTHKFNLLQERTIKNRRTNNKMKFLKETRESFEAMDEKNGGTFSTKGFGNFKEELANNGKLMRAYRDLYNSEDMMKDVDGAAKIDDQPKSMQILMIEQFMAEKSNQIQEAVEDLTLSKNDSAISSDLLKIYRASDLTPGQATQATAESIFDPANLAPAAAFGKLAKIGNKIVGKVGSMFGKEAVSTANKHALAAATGGAVSTGIEDAARQQVEKNAQYKDEIDLGQLALATGAGAVLGGGAVKAIQGISHGIKKLFGDKGVTEATTHEELATIVEQAKEDKTLTPDEINEIEQYQYEQYQKSDNGPAEYKTLEGSKKKADDIADEIEAEVEVEAAASIKPKVTEKEETVTTSDKEKEKEEESENVKITVDNLATGEKEEIDLGTTTKSKQTPIADMREEDRLGLAKEFILGKNRMKRVGDDTSTEGDIPLNATMQAHVNARSVDEMANDKGYRTVDQVIAEADTPEQAVALTMNGYDLYKNTTALDADKRIGQSIERMEHERLAIEGLQNHYKEQGIEGDFTALTKKRDSLLDKIKKRSADVFDAEVAFKSKSDFAEEFLPNKEREAELENIEKILTEQGIIKGDVKALMNTVKKITNFSLGEKALRRVKGNQLDALTEADMKKSTLLVNALNTILTATDKKGKPLSAAAKTDRIRKEIPGIIKQVMSNANDDASKIVAFKLQKEFDDAAGFKRKDGTIGKKPKADAKPEQKSDKEKEPGYDSAGEALKTQWENHSPDKTRANMHTALKTKKYIDDTEENLGVYGEIYTLMKQEGITPKDRAELEEALTHAKTQSEIYNPIDLSKKKKEAYIARKNNEESMKVFNQELVAKDVTQLTSERELFDAASQVAQIVGVFFGDIKLFKAIGATKDSLGIDYRMDIARDLRDNKKILPADMTDEQIKKIVKVPTRNVTYVEGRATAIRSMMEDLNLPREKATQIYDNIMKGIDEGNAAGLRTYAKKIADNVTNKNIPAKFELTLPDGKKVKVDARDTEEVTVRMFGFDWKSKKKTDQARPGTIAATIVQSIDSYIKTHVINNMKGYDGITVHDGYAFKTDAEKARATELYIEALKIIHADNYLNKTLHKISGGKIPLEKNKPIDWSQVVPEKLFSPEFHKGKVDVDEIRTNMSLNSDRLMKPTEMLSSLLNAADPTGKTGFTGARHSVIRFMAKSKLNQYNPKTFVSELDDFTATVLLPDSLDGLNKAVKGWQKQWMQKNKVKPSPKVDKAFEELGNMIRSTAETIPRFDKLNVPIMEKESVLNTYAHIYFKNLEAKRELAETERVNKSIEKHKGKDTPIEKIIEDADPDDLNEIISIVKQSEQEKNSRDVPTREQEQEVVQGDGPEIDTSIRLDDEAQKTVDESLHQLRKIKKARDIVEGDISHVTHAYRKLIDKVFKNSHTSRKDFRKYILDSGYRHIRGMTREQADRFKQLHASTIEKYGKYIDAKARAHTNPNERYGYFRNNMLKLVMEKENLTGEAAAVRANAILKLSAIKNMTDDHWSYVGNTNNAATAKKYLDIVDTWDGIAKEKVFVTGKENFNDSYLATVRGKITESLEMESESFKIENHTLGKIIDDEATLKTLAETPNREGYMEMNKIRKVGQKFYRIVVDELAEKDIMEADPTDILTKTVFTTMSKIVTSNENRDTRKVLHNKTIFPDEPTEDSRPITREEKQILATKAGIELNKVRVNHVQEMLGRQIFGVGRYEPLGGKIHGFLAKLTRDFKYNAVPINPSSIINGMGWTIASVMGRFPVKGLPALIKASGQLREYKKLNIALRKALESGDMQAYEAAKARRAESPVFKAVSDGMTINSIDGIMLSHSALKETSEKLFGKDTKMLHAMRTIFLRPHTPAAEQLVKLFSLSDAIGRMASYNLIKGTRHDSGVGAGIKANATFGDMDFVSSKAVESLNEFPLTAFIKWGERTFIEIAKLPAAQQATLIGSGLLLQEFWDGMDIENKGMNPLRTFVEMPDDFLVAPITDTYDKYSGDTSNFELAVRAAASYELPAPVNKLLMSYLFDDRNGSVQKKVIKLIFPPTGKNWSDTRNGTRTRNSGEQGPLTDFDGRAWWEQMFLDNSVVTQEQYNNGKWRKDVHDYIYDTLMW